MSKKECTKSKCYCNVKPGQIYYELMFSTRHPVDSMDLKNFITVECDYRPKGYCDSVDDAYRVNCFKTRREASAAKKKILSILKGKE